MPLREPRMELDKQIINKFLNWSGISLASICKFVVDIPENSGVSINNVTVYNRGYVLLEDTERRPKECWIISIWDLPMEQPNSTCLYQIPVPVKMRL